MNRINLFFIVMLMSFTSISLYAQDYNAKLLVKYDTEALSSMKQQNSNEFDFINYYVDHGFYFVEMPDKPIDYVDLEKINPQTGEIVEDFQFSQLDFDNFNPFEFNCTFQADRSSYYKVGDTGMLLIVLGRAKMENKIENEKRVLQNK